MKHCITRVIRNTAVAFILFTTCGSPSIGIAESLWYYRESVKKEFRQLITDNLLNRCLPQKTEPLFAYQTPNPRGDNKIAYEMVVRLGKPCFDQLVQKLKQLKSE